MTNPQAVEALPEELAERALFKAWAIEAGLMTAPDESGLCFKSDACRPAWAAWLMRSTLDATQPAPQPEAQALPDSRVIADAKQVAAVPVSGVIGYVSPAMIRHLNMAPEVLAKHGIRPIDSAPIVRKEDAIIDHPDAGELDVPVCFYPPAELSSPAPAPLSDRTFSALQAMTEGILTSGDPDYMGRRLTECVRVMADHGWQTPTPWPNLMPITVTFGPCGIGLGGGM